MFFRMEKFFFSEKGFPNKRNKIGRKKKESDAEK
jgi:hypothetical protein